MYPRSKVTLEILTPQRAIIFKDIRLRALQDTPTAFSSTYAQESRLSDAEWVARAAQWSNADAAAYLAMDGGIPCGIAAGFIDNDDPTRAYLASMWVAAAYRRSGVGRRLVEAILSWASARRMRTLLLTVTSNNHAAIGFYERLGFMVTGRVTPYRNDPTLFDLEMMRSIASS
jgi:ribosomal protein S18 acetylase RimI-like enzyme